MKADGREASVMFCFSSVSELECLEVRAPVQGGGGPVQLDVVVKELGTWRKLLRSQLQILHSYCNSLMEIDILSS